MRVEDRFRGILARSTPDPDGASAALRQQFHWECDESGEIDWVEGAPRGPLIGRSIAQRHAEGGVERDIELAFASRAPFEGVLDLGNAGAVRGTWRISGVPMFDPASGRFAGYRGVAERPRRDPTAKPANGADSLRELAHEVKTPLNAIIGFADIICGEYLGPAESRYRERAGDIAAQARILLTAIEDIELAASLRSSNGSSVADLSDCVARSSGEIQRYAERRGVTVIVVEADEPARCALDPQLAQRFVERFCVAVIDRAVEDDTLTFRIGSDDEHCMLSVNAPRDLEGADLRADRNRRASDSVTLPLRLVRGLARTSGGELDTSDGRLVLRLPRAGCAQAFAPLPASAAGACSSTVEPAAHNG